TIADEGSLRRVYFRAVAADQAPLLANLHARGAAVKADSLIEFRLDFPIAAGVDEAPFAVLLRGRKAVRERAHGLEAFLRNPLTRLVDDPHALAVERNESTMVEIERREFRREHELSVAPDQTVHTAL